MKALAIVVVSFVVLLPIHGQEKASETTDNKGVPSSLHRPQFPSTTAIWTVVNQETTERQSDGTEKYPKNYFTRLFSPENLPNIGLFIVGFIGIGSAISTLKKIERQTRAAECAAIAADTSLELSRDTAKRQLRAYMMADSVNICNIADPAPLIGPFTPTDARITHPEWGPVAVIIIRNTGQTPAHDVDHWGSLVYRENPLISNLPTRSELRESFLSVVGSKIGISKRLNIPVRLSPDEISGLMNGTGAIYLHGVINYKDVFKEPHTTHYRLMYTNGMSKVGISTDMTFAQEGNEAD